MLIVILTSSPSAVRLS